MKKRLFAGFPAESGLCGQVRAWRADYQQLPVKWIADKDMHFTAVAPWLEADPDKAVAALERLAGLFSVSSVHLRQVEFGPNRRDPRLIWAKGDGTPGLSRLVEEAHRVLGRPQPAREFLLHLTIARFRPEQYLNFPLKTLNSHIDWHADLRRFCLYQVDLKPKGADYRIIKEIEL